MNASRKVSIACVAVVLALPFGQAFAQTTYTIGGVVSGLTGTNTVGLTLTQYVGGQAISNQTLNSGNGNFQFGAGQPGSNWWVIVSQQPSGQVCSKANSRGKSLSGNVDNVAIACSANHVDEPPELCFFQPNVFCATDAAFGTYLEDTQVFQLKNMQVGEVIPIDTLDPDSNINIVSATVAFSSPNCAYGTHCILSFPNDYAGTIVFTQPGVFIINAPIDYVDNVLSSISLDISGVTQAIGTVTVTVNDEGASGACSSTNSNPCPKTATAVLYFDAYSAGTLPDRIFLDGFEQH